jgi:anaerobic ribonucleoside-triphosphate reductase
MNNGDIYTWEAASDRSYSIGWNLKTLIDRGLPDSDPPQTLDKLFDQMLKLIHESGNEWGGPITFNSFDNYIAPFLEAEKPSKQRFIDQMENFYRGINENHEVTISLDLIPRPGFPQTDKTQDILDAANKVILDTYRSRMEKSSFEPYFLVNLYPETDWESQSLGNWLELSYLFGEPTYQNFITGTISPETLRPRIFEPDHEVTYLRLGGANGNSEDQSVTGVACVNLAKIGSNAKSEEDFFQLLDERVDEVISALDEKRNKIEARFNTGKMPLTRHFLDNLDWGFSVITLVGINEALESLIDASLGHVAGKAVTYKVLEFLLRKLETAQTDNSRLFSLESYPSEKPGALLFDEYDSEHQYLTPASELKPSHGDDLWDVLEHQKKYHSMYTGGTLMQIHIEGGLQYNEGLKLLVKRTVETFGYNYLAVSPVFTLCPEHGYIAVERKCPSCDRESETYTRIDNKMTRVSSLLKPLEEAYQRRVYYDVKNQ